MKSRFPLRIILSSKVLRFLSFYSLSLIKMTKVFFRGNVTFSIAANFQCLRCIFSLHEFIRAKAVCHSFPANRALSKNASELSRKKRRSFAKLLSFRFPLKRKKESRSKIGENREAWYPSPRERREKKEDSLFFSLSLSLSFPRKLTSPCYIIQSTFESRPQNLFCVLYRAFVPDQTLNNSRAS